MTNHVNEIIGPVIPVPTPFKEDQSICIESMKKYVEFLVDNGISNVMTTVGTSRYNLMTFDEIKEINKALVDGAKGKAKTIVANPTIGGVKHAIEFAKHSEEIGADYLLLYFPERHYGIENTYKFFEQVSKSTNIKTLIHEMPMRNGFGGPNEQYSIELLEKLFKIDNIVGVKEEALDAEYSNKLVERFSNEAIMIGAGGGMSRYLYRDYERGSKAFLGGIGGFMPKLELEFFEAITSGNKNRATEIVEKIEKPYFEKVCPLGWHPSLKSAISLKGLMPKFEREPMKVFSDEEISFMQKVMEENQWL